MEYPTLRNEILYTQCPIVNAPAGKPRRHHSLDLGSLHRAA